MNWTRMMGFVFKLSFFLLITGLPAGARTVEAQEIHPATPPEPAITQHSIDINGDRVDYTATAGTIPLRDEGGKTLAHNFFIAYTKDGVEDISLRYVLGNQEGERFWHGLGFEPLICTADAKLAEVRRKLGRRPRQGREGLSSLGCDSMG